MNRTRGTTRCVLPLIIYKIIYYYILYNQWYYAHTSGKYFVGNSNDGEYLFCVCLDQYGISYWKMLYIVSETRIYDDNDDDDDRFSEKYFFN